MSAVNLFEPSNDPDIVVKHLHSTTQPISLEARINEAKKKAELFSSSLSEARKKESLSLKALEEDRIKWATAYSVKVVELEQVERQLAHAVDSMHLKSEPVNYNIVQSSSASHNAVHEKPNDLQQKHLHPQIDHSRELIEKLTKENKKLMYEVTTAKSELETVSKQLDTMRSKVESLTVENSNLGIALGDAEGKLNIRMNQVLLADEEKERLRNRERELHDQMNALESQTKLHRTELSVTSSELKTALSKIKILERQLADTSQVGLLTSQDVKIKTLEDLSSKLTQRIDNLEKTHKTEMSKLEAKNDVISVRYAEEQAKRQQLQSGYDELLRSHNEVVSDKAALEREVQSLQGRLMETQRMIPMLISERKQNTSSSNQNISLNYMDRDQNTVTQQSSPARSPSPGRLSVKPTVVYKSPFQHEESLSNITPAQYQSGMEATLNSNDLFGDLDKPIEVWGDQSSTVNLSLSTGISKQYDTDDIINDIEKKKAYLNHLQLEYQKSQLQLYDNLKRQSHETTATDQIEMSKTVGDKKSKKSRLTRIVASPRLAINNSKSESPSTKSGSKISVARNLSFSDGNAFRRLSPSGSQRNSELHTTTSKVTKTKPSRKGTDLTIKGFKIDTSPINLLKASPQIFNNSTIKEKRAISMRIPTATIARDSHQKESKSASSSINPKLSRSVDDALISQLKSKKSKTTADSRSLEASQLSDSKSSSRASSVRRSKESRPSPTSRG